MLLPGRLCKNTLTKNTLQKILLQKIHLQKNLIKKIHFGKIHIGKIHFGNQSLKAVGRSLRKMYHVPWSTVGIYKVGAYLAVVNGWIFTYLKCVPYRIRRSAVRMLQILVNERSSNVGRWRFYLLALNWVSPQFPFNLLFKVTGEIFIEPRSDPSVRMSV